MDSSIVTDEADLLLPSLVSLLQLRRQLFEIMTIHWTREVLLVNVAPLLGARYIAIEVIGVDRPFSKDLLLL